MEHSIATTAEEREVGSREVERDAEECDPESHGTGK